MIEDVTERHRTQQYEAAEQAVIEALAQAQDIEGGVVALLEVLCRHLDWDLAELWTLDAETRGAGVHRRLGRAPQRPRGVRGGP